MPQYIQVGNDVIEFPDGMSSEQITAALSGGSKPAPVSAPSSGLLMGIKDPISGAAQLLPKGLEFVTSAGGLAPNPLSRFFGSEAERVGQMVSAEEQAYQKQRAAQGDTGLDIGRIAGNIVSPANIVAGMRAAQGARALGAGAGMQAATAGAAQGAIQPEIGRAHV